MKFLKCFFRFLYNYYDNAWEDPFFSTSLTISLLSSSAIFLISNIIFYYNGIELLPHIELIFLFTITGMIIFYKFKKKIMKLSKDTVVEKTCKIYIYLFIIFLLSIWIGNVIIHDLARKKYHNNINNSSIVSTRKTDIIKYQSEGLKNR